MYKYLLVSVLALLLNACVSVPSRVAFDHGVKTKLNEVNVVNVMPQDEVIMRAEAFGASAALGGGLIGAIIDSKVAEGRQASLQDMLAPFYGSVDNFNYRAYFETALKDKLTEYKKLNFSKVESTSLALTQSDITSRVNKIQNGNGAMYISTNYTFTSDFKRLNLTSLVELRVTGSETPVFRNYFYYQSKSVGTGGVESIRLWSNNMGETYRLTMSEAANEVMKMLQIDLSASGADPQSSEKIVLEKIDGALRNKISGNVLASGMARKIVRNEQGHVYSLPQ